MQRLFNKYQVLFDLDQATGIVGKLFFGFMLTLPHLFTCLILIFLSPGQWIEIFIVGLLLPDFSYFFYGVVHPGAFFKSDFYIRSIGEKRKKIAHLLTFIVVVVLLVNMEYILFLAGGIHLLLDWIGF